jgi:hypothetical protein
MREAGENKQLRANDSSDDIEERKDSALRSGGILYI